MSESVKQAGSQQPLVRELYDVLAYIRPLAVAIAMDNSEAPWRKAKAERSVAKIDAAMISVDALPNATGSATGAAKTGGTNGH